MAFNSIFQALRLAAQGLGPLVPATFKADNTSFLASVSSNALIANLSDPYAGLGLGTTVFSSFNTVPDQFGISGNTIVAGNAPATSGTAYSVGVLATSGDGKRKVGETFTFTASGVNPSTPVSTSNGSLYIKPNTSGSADGTSITNAAGISTINAVMAQAVAQNKKVVILDGFGTYNVSSPLTITTSGPSKSNYLEICGQDASGAPAKPSFIGPRTNPWTDRTGSNGQHLFRLSGCNNLYFHHLKFTAVSAAFNFGGRGANFKIDDIDGINCNRLIENYVTSGDADATVSNVRCARHTITGYSRDAYRFQYDSNDIEITDVTGDSLNQIDSSSWANGMTLAGTAHNFRMRRVVVGNIKSIDNGASAASKTYINGDGFTDFTGTNYDILLQDITAYNANDAVIDLKAFNILIERPKGYGCTHALKFWGEMAVLDPQFGSMSAPTNTNSNQCHIEAISPQPDLNYNRPGKMWVYASAPGQAWFRDTTTAASSNGLTDGKWWAFCELSNQQTGTTYPPQVRMMSTVEVTIPAGMTEVYRQSGVEAAIYDRTYVPGSTPLAFTSQATGWSVEEGTVLNFRALANEPSYIDLINPPPGWSNGWSNIFFSAPAYSTTGSNTYSCQIKATSIDGRTVTQIVQVSVYQHAKPPALSIAGAPASTGTVGVAYSFTPTTPSSGVPNLTFALIKAADGGVVTLPTNMSFNTATGKLDGKPLGAFTLTGITIRVTDSIGQTAILPTFSVTVTAPPLYTVLDANFAGYTDGSQPASVDVTGGNTATWGSKVAISADFTPTRAKFTGTGSGTTACILYPDSDTWSFSSDFVVSWEKVRLAGLTAVQTLGGFYGSSSLRGWQINIQTTGQIQAILGNADGTSGSLTLLSSTANVVTAGTDFDIKLVRSGADANNVKLYLNNVVVAQGTSTNAIANLSLALGIGAGSSGAAPLLNGSYIGRMVVQRS